MSLRPIKAALRKEVLARRDALSTEEHQRLSRIIVQAIVDWPALAAARRLMLYVGFRSEIHTDELIIEMLHRKKAVVLPRVNRQTRTLDLYEIKAFPDDLEPGLWDMMEPVPERCAPATVEGIDFILVPGVAFDAQGRRMGYGGGFYDGLLGGLRQRLSPEQIVAAAFELQIVPEVPVNEKDIPIPYVITEKRLIRAQS